MSCSLILGQLRAVLRLVACAGFAFPLILVGCNSADHPDLGTVTGTVTNNGQPLSDAWIEFIPEQGRLSAARTDAEGHYSLQYTPDAEGAELGNHTVKIGTGGGQPAEGHSREAVAATARKQVFEKSGVTVESDENTLDFDISQGNEYKGSAGSGNRAAHGARR